MSTRAQAAAQGNQQDESPFRKFIAFAQVRAYRSQYLRTALSLPHPKANYPRLRSDTVRWASSITFILSVRADLDLASKLLAPKTAVTESPDAIPGRASGPGLVDPFSLPPAQAHLAWPLGIPLSLHFYLSTSGQAFSLTSEDVNLPHFVWHDMTFGDWGDARTVDYNIHLPEVRDPQSTSCFYGF